MTADLLREKMFSAQESASAWATHMRETYWDSESGRIFESETLNLLEVNLSRLTNISMAEIWLSVAELPATQVILKLLDDFLIIYSYFGLKLFLILFLLGCYL